MQQDVTKAHVTKDIVLSVIFNKFYLAEPEREYWMIFPVSIH